MEGCDVHLISEHLLNSRMPLLKFSPGNLAASLELQKNLFGEILGIKQSTIEFGVAGRHRWLRINDSLELDIEGIKGADQDREGSCYQSSFFCCPR